MAHARRHFYEVHIAQDSPLAKEAIERIGGLYQIEDHVRVAQARRKCRQRPDVQRVICGKRRGDAAVGKHGCTETFG